MKTVFLHIGLPKTGTTFLQSRVFPDFPVSYIHKSRSKAQFDLIHLCHRFFRVKSLDRLGSDADIAQGFSLLLKTIAEPSKDRILLSDENISVSLGGVWERRIPTAESFALRLRRFADFIQSMGADSHVICSVRRQDSWLASRYAESAKRFEDFSQSGFERFVEDEYFDFLAAHTFLNYERLHHEIVRQFGTEAVSFVAYEELERDPATHVRKLYQIVVGSAAPTSMALEDQDNRSRVAEDSWRLKNASGGLLRLSPELRQAIMTRFLSSNAAFIEAVGRDVCGLAEPV